MHLSEENGLWMGQARLSSEQQPIHATDYLIISINWVFPQFLDLARVTRGTSLLKSGESKVKADNRKNTHQNWPHLTLGSIHVTPALGLSFLLNLFTESSESSEHLHRNNSSFNAFTSHLSLTMGATASYFSLTASSIPLTPQRSAPPTPQNSSPVTSSAKELDHDVERIPYPSPESHRNFNELEPYAKEEDDDVYIKDEDMSDVLPSIEEEGEEQATWRAEHVGDGVMRFYQSSEADSSYDTDEGEAGEIDESYDANDRYANLDIGEKRRQEEQLRAAENPEEDEFDMAAFLQDQVRRGQKMVDHGWNRETVNAYMLIERREREILFPDSWRSQFPQFPADLFSNRCNPDAGLLRALTPNRDTTMKWAITKFLEMAPRVRNSSRPNGHTFYKRRPEGLVEEHIKQYAKMAYKDAGLERDVRKKHIPELFTFASAIYGTEMEVLEYMILQKLRRRAAQVLDLLRITKATPSEAVDAAASSIDGRPPTLFAHGGQYYLYEPPTIYGFVNLKTVCALVAYEPLGTTITLRQIAVFELHKDVYDVWNCIALALVVIWCRDIMLDLQEVLPEREYDDEEMEVDDEDL